jgi:hypothetical protein
MEISVVPLAVLPRVGLGDLAYPAVLGALATSMSMSAVRIAHGWLPCSCRHFYHRNIAALSGRPLTST